MDISQAQTYLRKRTEFAIIGGGYANVRFIPSEDVLFVPAIDSANPAIMSDDIVLKDGKAWINVYGTADKFNFTEKGSETRDNDGGESTLEASNPGSSDYVKWMLKKYKGACIVLFDEIASNKTMLLGSLDIPAYLTHGFSSGSKSTDEKARKITFKAEGDGLAVTYKGRGAKVDKVLIAADGTTIDMSKGAYAISQANLAATVITDILNAVIGSVLTIEGGSDVNSSTIDADNVKFDLVGGDWSAAAGAKIRFYIRGAGDYVELERIAAPV
jgi:hypothetical protein